LTVPPLVVPVLVLFDDLKNSWREEFGNSATPAEAGLWMPIQNQPENGPRSGRLLSGFSGNAPPDFANAERWRQWKDTGEQQQPKLRRVTPEKRTNKDMKTKTINLGSARMTALGLTGLVLLAAHPAQAGMIYIGNSLTVPNGAVDAISPLVILGEYSSAGPLATPSSATTLPNGTVQDVKFYGQNYDFTLYALSRVWVGPAANGQTFRVVTSQHFQGVASTPQVYTLPVSGFLVSAGDFLAFSGFGPFYPQNPNDALNSDATYEDSSAPGSFAASPPGGPGTEFTVGLNPDPGANYEYISDYFGNQGRTYGIGVDVCISLTAQQANPTNGIYVWTDETTSPVNRAALINACTDSCHPISVVLLSAWDNDNDSLWPTPNLQAFNTLAHAAGLRVFALFSDSSRIGALVCFNADCSTPDQRFDGCAMDYEGDPAWPSGGGAHTPPVAAADIDYYAQAKAACALGALPLHVSISYRWGTIPDVPGACITYNGVAKPSYEHILDQLDSVDVQTVSDDVCTIQSRVQPQATYASQVGKAVWATIETQEPNSSNGLVSLNTFYSDGETYMWNTLAQISFAPFPFTEFMLHYYQDAYSSGIAGWPVHPASLSPASASAGGSGLTLTINGFCFVDPTLQVFWNGVGLPTTFVSSSQLTATVPASDLLLPSGKLFATALITVKNAGVALPPWFLLFSPAEACKTRTCKARTSRMPISRGAIFRTLISRVAIFRTLISRVPTSKAPVSEAPFCQAPTSVARTSVKPISRMPPYY
jgi:IPT/TIG domain